MAEMAPRVVIVGASLAGLRTAEALQALMPAARVTLLGDEAHLPYNRPPLSKDAAEALAGAAPAEAAEVLARLTFRSRLAEPAVVRLGVRATGLNAARREVLLADGDRLAYDWLVAATGLSPRRLPLAGAEGRRHVLRSFDDACRLGAQLRPGARMLVIGAGFVGCEIAATAMHLGLTVTVIEPQAEPMLGALGPEVAAAMAAFHRARGIDLRCGLSVTGVADLGGAVALDLSDGSRLTGDLLVEAMGSVPNTGWLTEGALDLHNGVLCDDTMTAVGCDRLLAVGDIARFPNALFPVGPRRVEHWCVPGQTARRAAETIAAREAGQEPAPGFAPLPSFWSDQHGLRLQSFGAPGLADQARTVLGRLDRLGAEPCLVEYHRAGRLIGLLGLGLPPAELARHRPRLEAALAQGETV